VIVCVHGAVISSRYFGRLSAELSSEYRVLMPDLPGYGRSDSPPDVLEVEGLAEALAGWAAALELRGAVWLGNSLGCQVIAELARRRTELVAALIFVGPTLEPAARSALRVLWRLALDAPMERIALLVAWVRDLVSAGLRRAVATIGVATRDRIEERLETVAVPLLVIRGERDPLVGAGWAREIADRAASRTAAAANTAFAAAPEKLPAPPTVAVVAGAAHAAHDSHPREVADLVRGFIRATSPYG
jgi:2-hydroxy-6-oxonona-2,4-dienedioate hydrolase